LLFDALRDCIEPLFGAIRSMQNRFEFGLQLSNALFCEAKPFREFLSLLLRALPVVAFNLTYAI
jgi:hypothetical protein